MVTVLYFRVNSKDANKHILTSFSITQNYARVILCQQEAACCHDLRRCFPRYGDRCSSAATLSLDFFLQQEASEFSRPAMTSCRFACPHHLEQVCTKRSAKACDPVYADNRARVGRGNSKHLHESPGVGLCTVVITAASAQPLVSNRLLMTLPQLTLRPRLKHTLRASTGVFAFQIASPLLGPR